MWAESTCALTLGVLQNTAHVTGHTSSRAASGGSRCLQIGKQTVRKLAKKWGLQAPGGPPCALPPCATRGALAAVRSGWAGVAKPMCTVYSTRACTVKSKRRKAANTEQVAGLPRKRCSARPTARTAAPVVRVRGTGAAARALLQSGACTAPRRLRPRRRTAVPAPPPPARASAHRAPRLEHDDAGGRGAGRAGRQRTRLAAGRPATLTAAPAPPVYAVRCLSVRLPCRTVPAFSSSPTPPAVFLLVKLECGTHVRARTHRRSLAWACAPALGAQRCAPPWPPRPPCCAERS